MADDIVSVQNQTMGKWALDVFAAGLRLEVADLEKLGEQEGAIPLHRVRDVCNASLYMVAAESGCSAKMHWVWTTGWYRANALDKNRATAGHYAARGANLHALTMWVHHGGDMFALRYPAVTIHDTAPEQSKFRMKAVAAACALCSLEALEAVSKTIRSACVPPLPRTRVRPGAVDAVNAFLKAPSNDAVSEFELMSVLVALLFDAHAAAEAVWSTTPSATSDPTAAFVAACAAASDPTVVAAAGTTAVPAVSTGRHGSGGAFSWDF